MERIAILTGEDAPELTADGRHLHAALERRGYDASGVRWTDPTVDWARFDAVVFRSCWEYYLDPSRFRDWLTDLEGTGVTVRNRPDVVRWSMHTSYLLELAEAGVSVVPSVLVEDTRERDLAAILERRQLGACGRQTDDRYQRGGGVDDHARERSRRPASLRATISGRPPARGDGVDRRRDATLSPGRHRPGVRPRGGER